MTKERQSNEPRGEVLGEAMSIINGARQDAYGKPEDNFATIAEFWTTYLQGRRKRIPPDAPALSHFWISPKDVAIMMTLLKIARIATGTQTRDSFVDAAGYIGIAADMVKLTPTIKVAGTAEAADSGEKLNDEEREAFAKNFVALIMGGMQKKD